METCCFPLHRNAQKGADNPLPGEHKLDAHFVKAVRAIKEAGAVWGDEDQFYEKAAVKFVREFEGWGGFGSEEVAEGAKKPGSPA